MGVEDVEDALEAARAAFDRHRWGEARAGFLVARARQPLSAPDMESFAEAAWWEGAIDESLSGFEEAYRLYLQGDDSGRRPAAMLALDIAFSWFLRGEEAMGSGWMSRAHRLLEDLPDCVERGYLQSVEIDTALGEGRYEDAVSVARSIAGMAERFGDETLGALARVGEGVARIKLGDVAIGMGVLDEAMLPVVAGRVRPAYAGNVYCQLMSVCHELSDLRRAEQWTDATAQWCAGFSSAVMFMGVCRVHRAQLMQVRGEWERAEAEIGLVCEQLASMNVVAVGLALYELGEIRRSRGDLTGAEDAYAEAHRHGCDPMPGLALVYSAQGRHIEALDALRRAESATVDELARTRLWEATVEVALAADEPAIAERCCADLERAASVYASSGLLAAAALARGRMRLVQGDAAGAAVSLDTARQRWQELDAPLHVARARWLLATAYEQLGDRAAAERERAATAETHHELGVVTRHRGGGDVETLPNGITGREAEVLGLVAQGLTNRVVAETLVLSEKTVARHLSNIYTKLDVSSRTAAAAWAHAHGLVQPPSA